MPHCRRGLNGRRILPVTTPPPPAFVAQLRAWWAHVGAQPPARAAEDPRSWRWELDSTLPISVVWAEQVRIDVGPWRRTFEPEDAAEMLDLVAAVLFGRARLSRFERGGDDVGHRLEILADAGWLDAGGVVPRWAWWRRPRQSVALNTYPAPAAMRWGTPGQLPSAPWVGMLDADAAEPGTLPIDGELDLHPFQPREVKAVVLAYLEACGERGITELRLVHGKGIGNLRRTVHALLEEHPQVASFRLGGMGEGSWGATIVTLHPPDLSTDA